MLRAPLLPGDSDLDQLGKIFACLGTPTDEEWPGMKLLPNYIEFEPFQKTEFSALFTAASRDALDLISKMLVFDPSKRISAQQALNHPYFLRGVPATPKDKLPVPKRKQSNETYQRLVINQDDQEQRDFESHTKMYGDKPVDVLPHEHNIIGKVLNFDDHHSPGNTSGLSNYSLMSLVGGSARTNRDSFGNLSMMSSDEIMAEAITSTPHNSKLISPASNLSVGLSTISQKRSFNESGIITPASDIGEGESRGLFDDDDVNEDEQDGEDVESMNHGDMETSPSIARSVRRKLDL